MNRIARRSAIAAVLAVALLVGFGVFIARFCIESEKWVISSGSPHVYDDHGGLECGVAVDAQGNLLLDMRDGWTYTENEALRRSVVHWVGDRQNNIIAPALNTHIYEMTGHDTLNGMYSYGDQVSVTQLTLAAPVQIAAYEALGDYRGTVAVYNYKTGQLLCSVSSDNFDPDNVPETPVEGMYFNRFTEALYTPGSIFKVVTLAAALESLPDIQDATFECTGSYTVDGNNITCEKKHGTQTLEKAFTNSCNCAFAQVALQVGAEKMESYVAAFGLTQSVGFDGLVGSTGKYQVVGRDNVALAWSGIGQDQDLINPCAFLRFMGAIAGGGEGAEPFVVERITVDDQVSYQGQQQLFRSNLSAQTISTLQQYLRSSAVSYGADRFGELPVCAKTGTAQVEGQNKPNAMLTGFVTDPEYPLAFIVCAENAGYGNSVCVPIAGKVLDACKAYMSE